MEHRAAAGAAVSPVGSVAGEGAMEDLLFVGITLAFFLLCLLYVRACARL